jgi:hypothetical protein
MAGILTFQELAAHLRDPTYVEEHSFQLAQALSRLVSTEPDSAEVQELVLRALEKSASFGEDVEILNAVVGKLGLFPYVKPQYASERDLLLLEFHRPPQLDGIVFHRVQASVYRKLLDGQNVALSAPTSFGKSLIIDALLAAGKVSNVVIVVPTLALIDETRRRLVRFAKTYKIITHSSQALSSKNIFVFTQERVLEHQNFPPLDLFIIDEFYKLNVHGSDQRSILLNQAFLRLHKTGAQFYMLGPSIEGLVGQLDTRLEMSFIRTNYSTVVSEVARVSPAPSKEEALIRLCQELEDSTLIYCASPKSANRVAALLGESGVSRRRRSLAPAGEWLRREYHQDWLLPKAVERGIGVHHGRLPRSIAQWMVRAFNDERLAFLVCTSTLIEGVNTRAKNVIIYDNKVARAKFDYFTFNNIRGRSGRMFRHFVGRVFLFHEPPAQELPFVDIPIVTQSGDATNSLLVQLESEELTTESKHKLAGIWKQNILPLAVIRSNAGIEPDWQIELAETIENSIRQAHHHLSWTGYPSWEQLLYVCNLIWTYLVRKKGRVYGVSSGRQLAYQMRQYASRRTPRALVEAYVAKAELSATEAVEEVLGFLRYWASFHFPQYLRAVDRIQRAVFERNRLPAGNYSVFATQVENSFLDPALAALEEYGIPTQVAAKLQSQLGAPGSLDQTLEMIAILNVDRLELHPFEYELVTDARSHI